MDECMDGWMDEWTGLYAICAQIPPVNGQMNLMTTFFFFGAGLWYHG